MYPSNDENKNEYPETREQTVDSLPDIESGNVVQNLSESGFIGLPYNESGYIEPSHYETNYTEHRHSVQDYVEPVYTEPVYYDQRYNSHAYHMPIQQEPVYYSEHLYSELAYENQNYNEQDFNKQAYTAPVYNEHGENPMVMYSPGICVNQPFPRPRENGNGKNGSSKDSGKGLVGFLRAAALILICTVLSAAATYIVIDRRIERGDLSPPAQVVLGSGPVDRRPDDNTTTPVVSRGDEMTAQDIYDMARHQVVVINTEAPNFLGLPDASRGTAPISGSGFIVSSDGYILTNYHVIEIAHQNGLPITVVLYDGKSFEAEVIGFERNNDVAVIKIDAPGLNPVFIGNSDHTRVGQTIYAIGNPFGDLVYTMTDGIVSALDRVVSVEGKSIRTFQFSAAVNSGNSGGPIFDTRGEVIGIVTAKVVRGNVEGIGFAIPINDAVEIATELIEHGYISGRPLIGITGQNVSPANAEYFDWAVVGVYIRGVVEDSAADNAGLEIGDIIIRLGGEEVTSMEILRFALRDHRAGDTTSITVWRQGESIDLTITFDEDMFAGQPQLRPAVEPDSPDPFAERP